MDDPKLSYLAEQLEALNARLEAENRKMRRSILLLTDIIDDILPHVVTDPTTLQKLKEANHAAREAAREKSS